LICHETIADAGTDRFKGSVLVEHVLTRHPEQIRHRGPLLIEALGCFGLEPQDVDPASSLSAAAKPKPKPRAIPTACGPVLVVEDNDDVREAMLALIASAGFRVRGAENGQQALEVLRDGSERPSLIVLDLMMPVMNGLEFRQQQLADPALSPIPVVVVTAYGHAADRHRFRGAEVLGKPIELERMLDVVRERCLRA
jgi:CheY-like chemotaxis protein